MEYGRFPIYYLEHVGKLNANASFGVQLKTLQEYVLTEMAPFAECRGNKWECNKSILIHNVEFEFTLS